jgi:hypothetical protein
VIVVEDDDVVDRGRDVVLPALVVAVVDGLGRVVDDDGGTVVLVVGRICAAAWWAPLQKPMAANNAATIAARRRVTPGLVRGS